MTELAWVIGVGIALLLLFRFPREMLIFVGFILLCGLGAWGYFYRENSLRETDQQSVVIVASLGNGCSDAEYPLSVVFQNHNKKRLMDVSFFLEGREPQHSKPVYTKYITWDGITDPGQSSSACWSIDQSSLNDRIPAALEWSGKVSSVTFE